MANFIIDLSELREPEKINKTLEISGLIC